MYGSEKNAYKILVGKSEGKRQVGSPNVDGNVIIIIIIIMDYKEVGLGGDDGWILLPLDETVSGRF
jgi:hypothetical protein